MMRSLDIHEVWIGLNDLDYKDLYQWSDGTKVGYSNWSRSDTEDFDNGDHNCVVASDSGWMVRRCAEKIKFVCEYEPSHGSCDFKTGLCGWANDPEQNSPGWRRQFQDLNNRSIAFNICGGNVSSLGNNVSHTNPYPYRVSLYDNNTKPGTFTIASLLSRKIYSTVIDSYGVCLQFRFRLTGQQTELGVIINRKGMAGEPLWKVHGSNQSLAWKQGR
ncbi:Macrophage mannose receptor 1, partial, partial [Paramuricea clavata]